MSELAERLRLPPKTRRAASAKATPIRKSNIKSTWKNSGGSDREQGTALAATFASALERKAVRR
jgi:hypothetical protein